VTGDVRRVPLSGQDCPALPRENGEDASPSRLRSGSRGTSGEGSLDGRVLWMRGFTSVAVEPEGPSMIGR
jgi:hypothetical protein